MGLPAISSPCLGLCGGCCHFVQFSKVKFQCQHLSLLHFPSIRYQIFMKLWQTWMSELSAKILLSVLFSISPLISQHPVLLLQKCWSKKTVFSHQCYVCAGCICKNFVSPGHFLGLFSFLTVYATVSVVFAVLLLWTLSALLPRVVFLLFLGFWIPSHAKVLSFVISLILLDNLFWLVNFSLLYQGLILIIVTFLCFIFLLIPTAISFLLGISLATANYNTFLKFRQGSVCSVIWHIFANSPLAFFFVPLLVFFPHRFYISINFIVIIFSFSCLKTLEHSRYLRTSSNGTLGSPDHVPFCWGWLLAIKLHSLANLCCCCLPNSPGSSASVTFNIKIFLVLFDNCLVNLSVVG